MSRYHYSAYGLSIASDLECPELLPAPEPAPADVTITLGPVPERLDSPTHTDAHTQCGEGVYQIVITGVARYRAVRGRSVVVEPLEGADEGDVRLFLLGTVFGALLHQRALLPLHVSAVAVDGRAHAFAGDSGAGKSTLAAALHRHDLPLLCDDVGVVVPEGPGAVLFYPGFPRIKLWQNTLNHFGIDSRALARDLARADKYHLLLHDTFHRQPLPLAALYQLERADSGSEALIEPLDRAAAVGLLLSHTYRRGLVRQIGDPAAHLRQCAQVAGAIRAYRYVRPWDLTQLDGPGAQALLRHLFPRSS